MTSTEKRKKEWGGKRKGAGRPAGPEKFRTSIAVEKTVWDRAMGKWEGSTASSLVEKLLSTYVEGAA